MDEHIFTVNFQSQDYRCFYIKDPEKAVSAVEQLLAKGDTLFSLDTETEAWPKYKTITGAALSPHLSKIRLIQICDGKNAVVFDMAHIYDPKILFPLLTTRRFVGHNSVFDMQFLHKMGLPYINMGCTYILAKLFFHATTSTDEGLSARLGDLINKIFKEKIYKTMGASDWSNLDLTFEQVEYAALDAITTLALAKKLAPILPHYGLERTYKFCKEAQYPIVQMQLNGINFDAKEHLSKIASWRSALYRAKKQVMELIGEESLTPTVLTKWLEKNLPKDTLSIWPRTETGKLSVDTHTFADFDYLPICAPFAKYEKLRKLTTSFGMNLIQQINPATRRLHASYNIMGTRTGRLSCNNPNLQQYPRDPELRTHFIPYRGEVFVCADYSQIELRVAAELSQDKAMLEAYRKGIDLHNLTASIVAKKPLTEVTKQDRQMAKALNFGLLYGLGAKKFKHYAKKSYNVEVSQGEAIEAVEAFRETYSGYREWQVRQADNSAKDYTVRTPHGKLRCLDKDNCYGASMNTPIQGGAAEVMLYALVLLHRYNKGNFKLVNCVHDEILLSCKKEDAKDVKEILEQSMTEAYFNIFPDNKTSNGLVESKIGKNWGDVK